MKPIIASIGTSLLSGLAIALAAFDHSRPAIAAIGAAVLLLTYALHATIRRPRP